MVVAYHTHEFQIPTASEAEVAAGTESGKVVTPATLGSSTAFATAAQGALADSAVQIGDAIAPAVTANTMLVDNAAGTARETKTFVEVREKLGSFATVAALTAATISSVVQYVDLAGYAAAGDGGGHRLVRISTPSPVKAWHRQSADGAYWEVSEERPTPRMFGAAGNGSTNDSTAVQAANDYAAAKGRTLFFDTGSYRVAATITISAAWSMADDAFITCAPNTRSLTSSTKLLSCAESGLRFGPINIDGNSSEFWAVLYISGSNNYLPSISIKNLRCSCTVGDNPINRAVVVTGDNNVVPFTFFKDFTEVNSAVTYPTHGLVCEGTATGNLFHNVTSRNIRGTVVDNAASGTNHYGHICAHEARGNGLYGVNAGKSVVGTLTYDGSDNACGFRHGHSSQIGEVIVSRSSVAGAAIFFGNCGDVSISNVNAKNCGTLFLTNDTDGTVGDTYTTAGNISIGVVRAELKNGYPFFFSASQGPVKSLRVGDFNAVITIDDLTNFGPASFMNLGGVEKVEIDRINVKLLLGPVIDTVRSFALTVKNPLAQKSYIDEINAEFYELDGVTPTSNGLFAIANVGQQNLRVDRGLLNTSGNSIGISNTTRRGCMTASGVPSAGYWPVGAIIHATAPTSARRGWVCIAAGTPGTWSPFGDGVASTFETVADMVTANYLTTGNLVRTLGYYAAGDGGGNTYKVVASGTGTADGGSYINITSSSRQALGLFPGATVNVRQFGAKGDGSTSDSTAIQAADTYAASVSRTLKFPGGVYPANALTQTAGWDMSPDAEIKYNGSSFGEGVRLTASGTKSGTIRMNFDAKEPRTGYYLEGNDNRIDMVDMRNVVSSDQAWVVRTFYVAGNGNLVKSAYFDDLVNTGNTNDSSPQALVTDLTADRNEFDLVYGENCRSTVVNAASGANSYGRVVSRLAQDNGFYAVGGGVSTVGEIVYKGSDNACGFRSGANVTIGTVHVISSTSTSLFFGDCGNITVGDILIDNGVNAILHLNLANTGHIKIGSIRGKLTNTALFAMPSGSGTVRSLSIGSIDLNVAITDLTGWSQSSWMEFTACQELHLGDVRIKAILTGITGSGFFYANFPTTTYDSVVDSFRVFFYDSDGVTIHPTRVFYARYVTNGKTLVREGVLDANANLRAANYSTFRPGQLVSGTAPSAGTWKRGTFVAVENPSASNPHGWVCVTGGTPGTWKATANLVA